MIKHEMSPESELSINDSISKRKRIEFTEGLTSGYSSHSQSLQSSQENLTSDSNDGNKNKKENEDISNVIPVVPENELDPYRDWYDKLLAFREEYLRKERGAFPPFPPQPPPSSMIAASKAGHFNTFDQVKNSNIKNYNTSWDDASHSNNINRFRPSDFPILPPPHVFLAIIRILAPHQYVDLTYALAGSVLQNLGVKIPEYFPPLPPKIEPLQIMKADHDFDETDVSSQSSSDGEYSDDSESVKMEKRKRKDANLKRREARRYKIMRNKGLHNSERDEIKRGSSEGSMPRFESQKIFEMDHMYKSHILRRFIPQRPICAPVPGGMFMPPYGFPFMMPPPNPHGSPFFLRPPNFLPRPAQFMYDAPQKQQSIPTPPSSTVSPTFQHSNDEPKLVIENLKLVDNYSDEMKQTRFNR